MKKKKTTYFHICCNARVHVHLFKRVPYVHCDFKREKVLCNGHVPIVENITQLTKRKLRK